MLEQRLWPTLGGATLVADSFWPVVLKASPVQKWAALSLWDPEYLVQHGPDFVDSIWYSTDPCLVYGSANGELGGRTGMHACAASSEPPVARKMKLAELFAAVERGVAPHVLYWQDELSSLGPKLAAEIDAEDLIVNTVGGGESAQLAWLGTIGATTHAHYDVEHNFFAQIRGTKRFVLWPPQRHDDLALHPTRHPHHRQSRLADPLATACEGGSEWYEVELQPGQLLYVPPFWLHHVTATSRLSLSVSVWSPSEEAHRRRTIEALPLPWEADWPVEERWIAATQLVRQVLVWVYGGQAAAAAALDAHLYSRFGALGERPPAQQLAGSEARVARSRMVPTPLGAPATACADAGEAAAKRRTRLHEHVARGVPAIAAALRNLSRDDGVRDICTANYLEMLAAFVAGPDNVHVFLRNCCLGAWMGRARDSSATTAGWLQP